MASGEIRIAIVGSAGKTADELKKLSKTKLEAVAKKVNSYIKSLGLTPRNTILVSGGSAWIDHVAIQLYLTNKFSGLELYLPCSFDLSEKIFEDTPEGKSLNKYHQACADKIGVDVFEELYKVICDDYVTCEVHPGFFNRNSKIVENADHLLAFTFGEDAPSSGGTFNTWSKAAHLPRTHFNLDTIVRLSDEVKTIDSKSKDNLNVNANANVNC
jgi:hypothetical protein